MGEVIGRIDRFPQDGKVWVVRWIGRIGFATGETPSPMVDVQLSLGADTTTIASGQSVNPLLHPETAIIVRVKAGLLPLLPVGSRFRDGIRIASSNLLEHTFFLNCTTSKVMRIGEELSEKPASWTSNQPYRLINKFEYSLPDFLNTKCAVLQSDLGIIAIPCTEVLRTMFGCHQDIINALVSGPWPDQWQKSLANPARTGIQPDGEWQICLRPRIEDDKAPLLANAILNEYGRHQASAVHSSLLMNNGAGFVGTSIPFDVRQLKIVGKAVSLGQRTRKFLLTEITQIYWPNRGQIIRVGRDNDADIKDKNTPVERPKPYSRTRRHLQADPEGVIDVVSDEDPAAHSETIRIPVSGPKLCDEPELRRLPKEESHTYLPAPVSGDGIGCDVLSPGEAHFGDTAAGKSTYSSEDRRDTSSRLKELVEMLNLMMQRQEIQGWAAMAPKSVPRFRGELPVWPLPNRLQSEPHRVLPWAYIDRIRGVRRSALVCQIVIGDRNLIWIEIECRPTGEGFRSLIFDPGKNMPEDLVQSLLGKCLACRGIWPPDQMLRKSLDGISAITTWTHSYNQDGTLKSKSALGRLQLTLAIGQTQNAQDQPSAPAADAC